VWGAEIHRDSTIIAGFDEVDRQHLHIDSRILDGAPNGLQDLGSGASIARCSGDSGIAGLTRARRQLPVEIDLFRTPYAPAYQWPFWGGI
jgi:hypothetical protein